MRIRKRSAAVVTTAPQQPLPISYKYQTATVSVPSREGSKLLLVAECSNMQETRHLDGVEDHGAQVSRSDLSEEIPGVVENTCRLSDAHVKDDSPAPLADAAITDKGRRKQSSPTKRRKIEHDSNLTIFEGPSSMTAAELLAVTELANGVRQRLEASELSTSEQGEKAAPPENAPWKARAAAAASETTNSNSKDALISSIFYVFDTHGDHGLSASEVVKHMIDQGLPGLKEGGARHTVQVANVLRSSSSFFSLGDKKYLLCATVDSTWNSSTTETAKSSKPSGNTRNTNTSKGKSKVVADDSSENELAKAVNTKLRLASSKSTTRTGKKVQAEKLKDVSNEEEIVAGMAMASSTEPAAVVVRVARRRGPSSSQKGKGPTQCKRYDGRGWQCARLTEPGYSLCVHHQDLINKRAAKLKEQQTLSRLMESVQRKAKNQGSTLVASPADHSLQESQPTDPSSAPVQKRKMLSLLAINK